MAHVVNVNAGVLIVDRDDAILCCVICGFLFWFKDDWPEINKHLFNHLQGYKHEYILTVINLHFIA